MEQGESKPVSLQQGGVVWQAYCFASGMSELAYDISYLFESDMALAEAPLPRVAKVASVAPPGVCDIVAAQDAFARELLQFAEIHDNWISQYERIYGTGRDGQ